MFEASFGVLPPICMKYHEQKNQKPPNPKKTMMYTTMGLNQKSIQISVGNNQSKFAKEYKIVKNTNLLLAQIHRMRMLFTLTVKRFKISFLFCPSHDTKF